MILVLDLGIAMHRAGVLHLPRERKIHSALASEDIDAVALANHIGYSYRQVQKYAKGADRVSASLQYEFSGVPASRS